MKKIFALVIGFALLLTFHTASASAFTDVMSNHQYYNAINYLYENGIIEGYEDNTFRPDQLVNRVEALKIILLGSNVLVPNIQAQEIFPDVLHGTWYDKYVVKAKNLGVVKGDDLTGLFRPGDTVNLAEALKILLKANDEEEITPFSSPYLDVSKDAWFAPYFEYAFQAKLLDQAGHERVYPATPVTRGLLSELMYRLAVSNFMVADGKASYYGEKFHGRTTASGEVFDASAFTAAHLTYPFHTKLRVTNVENGKSVVVRINDRGPYVTDPTRIIDLSKASFEYISPLSRGIIEIKIQETMDPVTSVATEEVIVEEVTEEPTPLIDLLKSDLLNTTKSSCPEAQSLTFIPGNTFQNITLDDDVPSHLIFDEILTLKGSASVNTDVASAFIIDSDDNQTSFSSDVKNGKFAINVRFPKTGTFRLGVLPGKSGSSIIQELQVLKNTCIEEVESSALAPVSGLNMDMQGGDTVIQWNLEDYNLFKITFSQAGLHKSYILHNLNEWRPVYKEFTSYTPSNVDLSLRGGVLTQNSVLEPAQILWSPPSTATFMASSHHEYEVNEEEVELISLTNQAILKDTIKAIFKPKVPIRSEAAVILPSGKVTDIMLTSSTLTPSKNQFDIEVFPASSEALSASYQTLTTGVHFLEVNNAEGLAVINVPVYIRNQFPLLPNIRDLSDQYSVDLGNDFAQLKNEMLALVNSDRNEYNLSSLVLDSSLNQLAQYRSDDMVNNDYFGHWNKQGNDANDLRLNYGIQTLVGENLARDITLELAEYGLMRSAIHRSNILSEEWTRVGFGITRLSDDSYVFVQIFSTDPLNMDDIGSLRGNVLDTINENRGTALMMQNNLNSLAQNWTQKMVDEDFFDFTDGGGQSLVDTIHDAGVTASLGTYIMGNSSFADVLTQISENVQLQENNWKNLGIGIEQDNLGIIKITLIYTE